MALHLKNPHSVVAVLETRPEDIRELHLPASLATAARGAGGGSGAGKDDGADGWDRVARLAREKGVRPQGGAGRDRDRERGSHKPNNLGEGGRFGNAEAVVQERDGISIEELFADAREKAGGKGVWLALDNLQDPHNVGAIFRAAAFFGVQGIVLTEERSAPLTATVYDVASGGVEYVPFTRITNLQRAFEAAKEAGLWILGTSEHATEDFAKVERDRPWLLVFGTEEKGMRRLTQESCDVLCAIKPAGAVTSLNVSVAAGVFISRLTGSL